MSQGDEKLEAGGWGEQSRLLSGLGGLKAFSAQFSRFSAAIQQFNLRNKIG